MRLTARADDSGAWHASCCDEKKIAETSRGKLDATGTDAAGWQRDRRVDILLQ